MNTALHASLVNAKRVNLPPVCAADRRPGHSRTRGFTLVEVMVALILIAIGMLGIAKMQAVALSSTTASRSRALAALEASSLAAAMHANRAFWASAASTAAGTLGTITVATSSNAGIPVSTNGAMQAALTAVSTTAPCGTSATMGASLSCFCASGYGNSPCTANSYLTMAASDLYDWGAGLGSLLPNATATVSCEQATTTTGSGAPPPVDCTIQITWTENTVGVTTQETTATTANTANGNTAALQNVSYSLYVVP